MLTIGTGHSASYLLDEVGSATADYYTGAVVDGEPPGEWHGKGATTLGLAGQVDADVMEALYGDFVDPRDPLFDAGSADAETRELAERLGRAPKRYRSPETVVAGRVEEYTQMHAAEPSPEQIRDWTVEAERAQHKAVMFYDLTYSPPKSVTVLWAAYSRAAHEASTAGDTERAQRMQAKSALIESAIGDANRTMLDHVEAQTVSRIGRHGGATTGPKARAGSKGTGRWVDAQGLVVASFAQHTSRDNDPQLHVHNAVLNRVECPDGEWRAIDGKSLFAAKQGASAIASMELREHLSRDLGVEWTMREDGNDFEIAGIEQHELDLLSSRTRTMTAKAEELIGEFEAHHNREATAWERNRLRQQATLATRQAKAHTGETQAEMLDRADATMRAELAGGLTRIAERFEDAVPQGHEVWSPDAVIAQAVEACHGDRGRSTFNRSDLARQIHLALPSHLGLAENGEARELIERLTDHALATHDVVQTSGHEIGTVPDEHRLANGRAATIGPDAVRYAGRGHVAAEHALLRASGDRGRHAVPRGEVMAWLDDVSADDARGHLSPAQREAVAGLASTDASIAVLVGPAGTGKSYTVGRLADAWSDLTGGRVVGVATAQVAADVLRDDGLADTANTTAFLAAQRRISSGRRVEGDERWELSERDVLVVDEASMVDTATLTRLQATAEQAGARVVLLGDPRQLGAVGAGGMMRTLVETGAEVYTLGEVRRFEAEWERDASLRLRDGDGEVVVEYDRRGRLVDAGTQPAAVAMAARAAAADRLAGRETIVVTGTNRLAGEVSAAVRRHLVKAGVVGDDAVILGRDGCTAGVGDVVQARRIDRTLGLTNRETYEITGLREDGGLDVVSRRTGETRIMPPGYVAADAALGYAGTVHAAQGATLDTGHLLLIPGMTANSAYVGLTRGRGSNTAWVITDAGIPDAPRSTPRSLLAAVAEGGDDPSDWSAHDIAGADESWRTSAETLLGLTEDHTRLACRARLDAQLDELVADGHLAEGVRARFGADQGSEHLARQLRALEQAGHDPADVLREAVTARSLDSAVSVAQVVAGRIDRSHGLPVPQLGAAERPGGIGAADDGYLGELRGHLQARRDQLGADLVDTYASTDAEELPGWLAQTLGAVPYEPDARAEWAERAGVLAGHREASGWDDAEVPLGRCPGVHTPEKRLDWHEAYAAAGMPEERRPEAELTDGRLMVRAAAAERIQGAAPAFVDEPMRARHLDAERAAREATLARSRGDDERAADLDRQADEHAAAAGRLARIAEQRGRYLVQHAETLGAGASAREELIRRGLTPGMETDRTTAADWLAAEQEARTSDDAHRPITEVDLHHAERSVADAPAATSSYLNAGTLAGAEAGQATAAPNQAIAIAPGGQPIFRPPPALTPPPTLSAAASTAEIATAASHAAAVSAAVDDAASQDSRPAMDDAWEWRRSARDAKSDQLGYDDELAAGDE